jgi:hypothetical protein
MKILVSRVPHARWVLRQAQPARFRVTVIQNKHESFSTTGSFSKVEKEKKIRSDPRISLLGRAIEDEFATIREKYGSTLSARTRGKID